MKLYAISDLHIRHHGGARFLEAILPHREDWLIVAGDIGESEEHLRAALAILGHRFGQLIWVPGNHDLWTLPTGRQSLRGEAKYQALVSICRSYGVLTPEDPYPRWPGEGPPHLLAPLFLLYDYGFRPHNVPPKRAVEWAMESGVVCADELLLRPDPFSSLPAWCAARYQLTVHRLEEARASGARYILINHWPLRQDLIGLSQYPRFALWCGTRATEDWHTRFPVSTVVHGHLHQRGTQVRDGVRFEEVSLGYPQDWDPALGVERYLRQILPE